MLTETERIERLRARLAEEFGRDLWDDECQSLADDHGDDAEQDLRDYLANRVANQDRASEWWKTLARSRLDAVRSEIRPGLLASLELECTLPADGVGAWLHARARAEPKTGDRLLLHIPRSAYPPHPTSLSGARALTYGDFDEHALALHLRAGNGAPLLDAYAGRYLESKDMAQPYFERPDGVGDLFWIALRVEMVMGMLLCSPQQALMFLLADMDAPFYAMSASLNGWCGLTMQISDIRTPGKEVASFYTQRVRRGMGSPARPGAQRPRDKASVLIRFIEERRQWAGFDWPEAWQEWNRTYPEWQVKSHRTMQSTYGRLKTRSKTRDAKGGE